MKYSFFVLLITAPLCVLASPHDEYYSSDIFTAIEEAKQRTHHYDYSRATRYNRSTSQSIPIPRLLNKEMAKTIIKTPDEVDIGPHADSEENSVTSSETRTQNTLPDISVSESSSISVKVTTR